MLRCCVPRCRSERSLVYLGKGICERHWDKLSREDVIHLLNISKKLMEGNDHESKKDSTK